MIVSPALIVTAKDLLLTDPVAEVSTPALYATAGI
jgi:hypothetical protein